MKQNSFLVIILTVVALLVAACQPVAAPGQSGPVTYTIGIALPETGSLGSFGTDFKKGVELAVEQMNAELSAAGATVQFATASADTTGTPDGAAKAVQTVVQSSGAKVVIGPLTTGEVLGAKQFADENQVVIVAPASSASSRRSLSKPRPRMTEMCPLPRRPTTSPRPSAHARFRGG